MDEIEQTQQTYRQIARSYATANQKRDPIQAQLTHFISLLSPGKRVLDIGCGPGFDSTILRQNGLNVTSLDLSAAMMQTGRQQHHIQTDFSQADMRYLPITTAQIDGIWACATLLHLPRTEVMKALHEFRRVLVPKGLLYVSLKIGDGDGWDKGAYGHPLTRFFTYWRPETFDPILRQAGFTITDGWIEPTGTSGWLVRYATKN